MPDTFAPFVAALADRYRVERELGRGGMATVFLAHDVRHDRPVALKVLHPELAASLGAERFLREIRIAARLRHPRILPVHDSGETVGWLWYTMPFVEGESLRQRLAREGQLPIEQALRITSQVLGALGYAHAHGVIHRDIKPENILLEGDEAVVADFGVARAISSAGQDRLTETGLAIGTPAYMSPEQATAEKELDGRSDLYAVGCVLYEMLAGQPPFVGASAQQLVARHLMDTPPPIRIVRATVPDRVERSVMRALAKLPVDRFDSAAEFAEALASGPDVVVAHQGVSSTPTATSAWPVGARGRRVAVMAGAALTLSLAAYLAWPRPKSTLDPNLVAVVPFRIGGAAPALNYLREGMIDLVAARLTGEGSAQAADPGSVMTAWRQAAGSESRDLPEADMLALARRLGAGQLLLGGIVGTTERLTINASLIQLESGNARITATVEGAADSLPQLVDRLIAELLTEGTVAAHGLTGLINTPLPALRHYLEGRSAQRRARYADAVASFGRALDVDSTFALAGLSLATAAGWSAIPGAGRRGLELAWASRDKLSPRDHALLMADVGPKYPETSTLVQHLRAWEQAAELAPDEPDRWYELGDEYYHEAPYLQVESSRRRAADAFRRSVALDSGASSIGHLLEIAVLDDDSAAVRRLSALYLARDSSGNLLDFYRWRIAVGLHDEPALRALRARYRQMRLESLWRIMNHAVLDGSRMDDADSAAAAIRAIAARSSDWQRSKTYLHAFEVNRGRPAAALADTAGSDEVEYGPHAALYERVLDALYGDGDGASGRQAARELERLAGRPQSGDGDMRATALTDLCVATLWRVSHGETDGARQAIGRLGVRAAGDTPHAATSHMLCAALLEAKFRFSSGAPGAASALDRLDSLMRGGPGAQRNGPPVSFTLSPAYVRSMIGISPVGFEDFANIEIARMREQQGDVRAALAALRRRPYAYHLTDYLAPTLREHGRLAALAGERAEAIRAYRHYLALRSDPEPALQPAVDAVRAELARLGGAR
ncbi:MAG TPA: serine/threonine-protein kinase [Gemmatimonadaceae bacterium]|nr:serine/threonine-protein kinase [Gemmatimonadaceae bacterium]